MEKKETIKPSRWLNVLPAVIGLVGVLVGGVITTGSSYLLTLRQEETASAAERQRRALEFTVATRLVAAELTLSRNTVRVTAEEGRWSATPVSLDAWDKHKEVLARELDFNEWEDLVVAIYSIETFAQIYSEFFQGVNAPLDKTGPMLEFLAEIDIGRKAIGEASVRAERAVTTP